MKDEKLICSTSSIWTAWETMQENMIAIVWPELCLVLQYPSVQMYLFTQVKEESDDTLSMGNSVITLMSRFPLYFSAGNTMIHLERNQLFYPIIQKQADRKCRPCCLTSWWLVAYQQYRRHGFLSAMFSLALLKPAYRILSQFITGLSFLRVHLLMTRFSSRALFLHGKSHVISFSVPL